MNIIIIDPTGFTSVSSRPFPLKGHFILSKGKLSIENMQNE